MKNKQKGSTLFIVIIILILAIVGFYLYSKKTSVEDKTGSELSTQLNRVQSEPAKKEKARTAEFIAEITSFRAAISEARIKAEMSENYSTVCSTIPSWIIEEHNKRIQSSSAFSNVLKSISKIDSFTCVNSKDKYAFSLPILKLDGSIAVNCIDSRGAFKESIINIETFSCR